MPSESLLQMRDDRGGRVDGKLLTCDLEDERPERIELRKLVQPSPRAEVRPRVDQRRATTPSAAVAAMAPLSTFGSQKSFSLTNCWSASSVMFFSFLLARSVLLDR
jgi:hypothetical protein